MAAAELRPLGTAPGVNLHPYVQALPGLAGFHRRIREVGATGELAWLGSPARPDETAVLISGFDPSRASHRGDVVTIEGTPDGAWVRVLAIERRALRGISPVSIRLVDASSTRVLASAPVALAP